MSSFVTATMLLDIHVPCCWYRVNVLYGDGVLVCVCKKTMGIVSCSCDR